MARLGAASAVLQVAPLAALIVCRRGRFALRSRVVLQPSPDRCSEAMTETETETETETQPKPETEPDGVRRVELCSLGGRGVHTRNGGTGPGRAGTGRDFAGIGRPEAGTGTAGLGDRGGDRAGSVGSGRSVDFGASARPQAPRVARPSAPAGGVESGRRAPGAQRSIRTRACDPRGSAATSSGGRDVDSGVEGRRGPIARKLRGPSKPTADRRGPGGFRPRDSVVLSGS